MGAETSDGEGVMQPTAVPGVAEAEHLYGPPQVRTYDLGDCGDADRFWEMWKQRQAEVVLVLRRPNGRLILQTKAFYPAGTYRLPTGGIRPGEALLAAVRRETREETGLAAEPVRFLGHLRYRFRRLGAPAERRSYVFLLDAGPGEVRPQDETEQITAFREVSPAELSGVAARLAGMAGEWGVWGRFRALAHEFVAGVLCNP
jgi:8-oxo-dGTP pyrophosphatase MutT (NUDIX family)